MFKSLTINLMGAVALVLSPGLVALASEVPNSGLPKKFTGNPESLEKYECPQWFRDAKFGIWSHWGPVSATDMTGNWYARLMYQQDSKDYNYHVKTFGHPSKFGYKDVINLWRGENFDPAHLMDLYKKAGAKYFVSMGAHHDNFDLWNSKFHKWNSVNYGPKKDIVGLWREQALKQGLRFGVSEHFERSYNWMQLSHGADEKGPLAGVPYDGNDPKYEDLYLPKHDDSGKGYPVNAPQWWKEQWRNRMNDLIVNYKPDLVYLDGAIPFEDLGMNLIADFFNINMANNGGKFEAVLNIKNEKGLGFYHEDIGVKDVEQGGLEDIRAKPWQTCDTTSTWFYTSGRYFQKSSHDVIVELVDVVSKNGNLLMNIPQKSDGTIDEVCLAILQDLERWFKVNGSAIYETRPYKVFGEGPKPEKPIKGVRRAKSYAETDYRYTTKANVIYAFCLKTTAEPILFTALKDESIESVSLLGSKDKITWSVTPTGLRIEPIKNWPTEFANSFEVKLKKK